MNVTGIIAEYNPFHNGHEYHIETARAKAHADYVIAVMSGNFLQRGIPAMTDKFSRAKMALEHGVDLVLELPSIWAVSSAEGFARAGVSLLSQLGCVDTLSFGCETSDTSYLKSAAHILNTEPDNYRLPLQAALKNGASYPAAREAALTTCMELSTDERADFQTQIASANNILALEYLRAIEYLDSPLQPLPIKRIGSQYHDKELSAPFASASAIRQSCADETDEAVLAKQLSSVMPDSALSTLLISGCFLYEDDFSALLHYTLLPHTTDTLLRYADSNADLCNRICNLLSHFTTWSDFALTCKSKNYTYTRISRFFCHVLLQQDLELTELSKSAGYAPYARILGFRKDAAPLLSAIKSQSSIPMITKLSDASKTLSPLALQQLNNDIFASDVYRCVRNAKDSFSYKNEYETGCLIV